MSDTAHLMINVFNGEREPFPDGTEFLVTISDLKRGRLFRDERRGPSFPVNLPFHDDGSDHVNVVAFLDGVGQTALGPVKLRPKAWVSADLMLLPREGELNFAQATWRALPEELRAFFREEDKYGQLLELKEERLATLLNVVTAAQLIDLSGRSAFSFFEELVWGKLMPDRFMGWVDRAMVPLLENGPFKPSPAGLHAGATRTFKQLQFPFANIQFSLHENDQHPTRPELVLVEFDMDLYQDLLLHGLLEVLPNHLTGGKTDPRMVYMLRWMAGKQQGQDFAPPYVIRQEEAGAAGA
jgi:hypothetical protein